MIFGAVLAGGVGSRMHVGSMPKQFLPLGDKPIIIHTLEKMLMCSKLDAVYIGINAAWLEYMNDLLIKYDLNTDKVVVTAGGNTRNDTIFNIINEIEAAYGEDEEHIIVTHDAVRPFVTLRTIEENIECALKYGACDTVVPAVDTIVTSNDNQLITSIPDRSVMYQGQTPQSFRICLLKDLYAKLSTDEKNILTDACKICVIKGTPVRLVQGNTANIKITTISDYKIAQAIVSRNIDGLEEDTLC